MQTLLSNSRDLFIVALTLGLVSISAARGVIWRNLVCLQGNKNQGKQWNMVYSNKARSVPIHTRHCKFAVLLRNTEQRHGISSVAEPEPQTFSIGRWKKWTNVECFNIIFEPEIKSRITFSSCMALFKHDAASQP
jgi:hypothetical protein